jgi:uncharacterized protein (DUF924 family)
MTETKETLLAFWSGAGPSAWYAKTPAFDAAIRARFEALHHSAARGELDAWAQSAAGALALLLLLDQVPRNLFRGSAHAFATDPLARALAERAIAQGFDIATPLPMRQFFYLPFEHSENAQDQARAVALCVAHGEGDLEKWARLHADIIARFGRFPHRNRALGRETSAAEQRFLDEGGFAG